MKVIVSSILTAYILIELLHWDMVIKRILKMPAHKTIKPFDCLMCLSFWISIGFLFIPDNILHSIFIVTSTALISTIVSYYITQSKLK